MMSNSTAAIQNKLNEQSALLKGTHDHHCGIISVKPLVATQFAFNLINSLAKTGYTSAVLITDLAGLEAVFLGMSPIGIGVSIPIAILFALAEAYAHGAESDHFNHSHDHDETSTTPAPLTWKQSICALLHYGSDVGEGVSVPLMLCKLAGIDKTTKLVQGLTYTAIGLYSLFGNAQEYINTRIAFQKSNERYAAITKPISYV